MGLDTRELFARLIQCEAGGEGPAGMQAVATVIMNRATINVGEFSRVNKGGDVRAIITQPGQFVCMQETVGGRYNAQNVYNMTPSQEHYDIVHWPAAGWRASTNRCFSSILTVIPVRTTFLQGSASSTTASAITVFTYRQNGTQKLKFSGGFL